MKYVYMITVVKPDNTQAQFGVLAVASGGRSAAENATAWALSQCPADSFVQFCNMAAKVDHDTTV